LIFEAKLYKKGLNLREDYMSDSEEARASIQKPKGLYEATAQAYPKYFEHFYVLGSQQVPLSDLISTADNSYPNVATYKKVNIFSHAGTNTAGDPI
jgi:hypothetical protein